MATAEPVATNLHLLRRIRVLIVSRDRRFLGLARFLLTRDDLLVESTSKPGELFERVQAGADVVVLDGSGSIASAARAAAEIEALYPGVGLVVVADDARPTRSAFRLLPKWGSLANLGEEIRRAYLRPNQRERQ